MDDCGTPTESAFRQSFPSLIRIVSLMFCVLAHSAGAETVLITRAPGGQANGDSWALRITPDGQWVAFRSEASNLGVPDPNGNISDLYLYDAVADQLRNVTAGANAPTYDGDMSADGGYLVFSSQATNLTSADANGNIEDVFLYDRASGVIQNLSSSGNGPSRGPSISDDGRYIAFSSASNNLVAGPDPNQRAFSLFIYDRIAGLLTRDDSPGFQPIFPEIGPHGRYVAFGSAGGREVQPLFLLDRESGNVRDVSPDASWAFDPYFTADGKSLFFWAEQFLFSDNNTDKVYHHDIASGATTSLTPVVENGGSNAGSSADASGRFVLVNSASAFLAPTLEGTAAPPFEGRLILLDRVRGTATPVVTDPLLGGIGILSAQAGAIVYGVRRPSDSSGGTIANLVLMRNPPHPAIFCGTRTPDSATERGLVLKRNCNTGEWFLYALGGGSTEGLTFDGTFEGAESVTDVTTRSFEATDFFSQPQPATLSYHMTVFGVWRDQLQFRTSGSVCFMPEPGQSVRFGDALVELSGDDIDLTTGLPCDNDDDSLSNTLERRLGTAPDTADTDGGGVADGREVALDTSPLAAADDVDPFCGPPPSSEFRDTIGAFVWCTPQAGGLRWNFMFLASFTEDFVGQVQLSEAGTPVPVDLEPSDLARAHPGSTQIEFLMGPDSDSDIETDQFYVDLSSEATLCIDRGNDTRPTFVGSADLNVTGAFSLPDLEPCQAPPRPPDPCGRPVFDRSGVYVWQNCNVTNGKRRYQVRLYGGKNRVAGNLTSTDVIGFKGIQLEPADELRRSSDRLKVTYSFAVGFGGVDGMSVDLELNAQSCFSIESMSPGLRTFVGPFKRQVQAPFNLEDFEACN